MRQGESRGTELLRKEKKDISDRALAVLSYLGHLRCSKSVFDAY